MTNERQARIIADKLLDRARQLGQERRIDSPDAKFHSQGAAIEILLALASAFNEVAYDRTT